MLNFLMTTFNFAGKMSDMKLERRLLRKQQTLDSALDDTLSRKKSRAISETGSSVELRRSASGAGRSSSVREDSDRSSLKREDVGRSSSTREDSGRSSLTREDVVRSSSTREDAGRSFSTRDDSGRSSSTKEEISKSSSSKEVSGRSSSTREGRSTRDDTGHQTREEEVQEVADFLTNLRVDENGISCRTGSIKYTSSNSKSSIKRSSSSKQSSVTSEDAAHKQRAQIRKFPSDESERSIRQKTERQMSLDVSILGGARVKDPQGERSEERKSRWQIVRERRRSDGSSLKSMFRLGRGRRISEPAADTVSTQSPRKIQMKTISSLLNSSTSTILNVSSHLESSADSDVFTTESSPNMMNAPNNSTVQCFCGDISCPFCNLLLNLELTDPTLLQ
ncbi:uncharacterized protein LOC111711715 [Eurytemora carolleeae]|uniref:uncharacterized protein LOC111711715 n=1 Tax=Eurytemora carolleeae TaxID=1294199 RepID=UPI000C785247|nr:uncharacterized protein LOC111711715 [Eurytemora carolleeae]|eukprot:XP_023341903.1 uncharacterized protein LOC111711715 [Eurytemora affinis]